GAHVAVHPAASLAASPAIDFVARSEFDFTVKEVAEGRPLGRVLGVSYRDGGAIRHTPERPKLEDMDALPFVVDVYRRDLTIENYVIGYLLHPYVSLYTGRGCPSKCTFCLWPQTLGGHRQPAHPQQREEGGPPGRRASVHPARQGARHPDPRHVRPRASRRDARDDRGDDPLRLRARSGHDPGVDRRALPWHGDAPTGPRA